LLATTTLENGIYNTRIMVTSLKPSVDFSESCNPVSVNAQGCAMYSATQIAVGTPVLLRLQTGTEATGQVAFCKASPSNDKLWELGIVLDRPGNLRGTSLGPKESVVGDDAADVLLEDKEIGAGVARTPESGCITDVTRAGADMMRIELLEQMRKEMDAMLTDARAKFQEELQAQRKNTAIAEALLRDAADVRSVAARQQSLPETLDRKVTDRVENALQQIEVRMDTLLRQAQSESEQLQQQLRIGGDEMDRQMHQSVSAQFEKAQHQFYEVANTYFEEKRLGIADATTSMAQVSDEIYSALQQRLRNEFDGKQEIITFNQNAITTELARLQAQVSNVDDRTAKLDKLSIQLEANFSGRLDQTVSETITQARTSMAHLLGEVRSEQLGIAAAEVESMVTTLSTRADSLIKEELRPFIDVLIRERDETQIQIAAVRQEKEELQLWLMQQDQDFKEFIEKALFDARIQGKRSVQEVLEMIENPVDKLSCEAKNKIEELASRQYVELGESIRRLRGELATLKKQAGDSLLTSFEAVSDDSEPNDKFV